MGYAAALNGVCARAAIRHTKATETGLFGHNRCGHKFGHFRINHVNYDIQYYIASLGTERA
jgi:hypothetical protein